MSGGDGFGDIVTGGMLASAVEPDGGETGEIGTGPCLNCGAPISGRYCSNCGQKAKIKRSLRAFFADMATQLLDFEGKVWRTLPMLAFKPGEMTRRYIDGERVKFVSPIALFIFSVFAMFAALSLNGALDVESGGKIQTDLAESIAKGEGELEELGQAREEAVAKGEDLEQLDAQIAETEKDVADLKKMHESGVVTAQIDDDEEVPDAIREGIKRIERNPEAFTMRVQEAASKYSWALIPLSAPFVWLLFPFSRKYKLYDHAVFVTYSIAFMMLLVLTVAGTGAIFGGAGWLAFAALIPPIHMYRQLRGAYELGRASAMLRTFLLITMSIVVLALFISLMLILGVF